MTESEYNSKYNPWGSNYESFKVEYETLEEWFAKINVFDRIDALARQRGKTVEYQTYIGPQGDIITDVTCQ
jgi:hypothetical protein